MKEMGFILALAATVTPLTAQQAPRVAGSLPPSELAALETIRTNVWVNWFSGDTAALHRVLGPELVAISPDSPQYQSLEETLAGSARFKANGGSFVSVHFDSSLVHRFGDVVVMFSHYKVVMAHQGKESAQSGRATEVFVRHKGKWVHTSWHLDVTEGQ